MPVPAVCAGDVVGLPQGFTNSHRNGFFSDVKVRQTGHQRACIEFVDLFFKLPDHHHAPVHPHPLFRPHPVDHSGLIRGSRHVGTPDICAKTSNSTAKSFSTNPIPRAAVKNSLVTAVVGMGTSSCRPSSSARFMSFCSAFPFSNVPLPPPTIPERFPSCSVITLPDTGESTRSPLFSLTLAASSRLNAGLPVLMSPKIFPGVPPASIPSEPFITAPNAAVFVTMENVKSAAPTTARGVSAHFMPFLTSHSAFERVRLYPVTLWPLLSSRFTISLPITPSPTNPRLAINLSPNLRVGFVSISVLTAWHLPGILSHLPHVGFHRFPCSRGIAVFHRFQNPFVMVLSPLRSAFHLKNSHSLFP